MRRHMQRTLGSGLVAAVALTAAGCDQDILEIRNPNVIEAEAVDPVADAPAFSRSAFQNFARFHGWGVVYGAWFTGESWVGDTFPTRNEFGLRNIDDRNTTLNGDVWDPLSMAISSSEDVLVLVQAADDYGSNVHVARAALVSGYSLIWMGDLFCRGTVRPGGAPAELGPELSTEGMLNLAIERFEQALSTGTAAAARTDISAALRTEAGQIANAARVGIARAHLQAGRYGPAIAAAEQVPEGFRFDVPYVDDSARRVRMGNGVFYYSAGGAREALVVPPAFREMDDPRVTYVDAGKTAQDETLRLYSQTKFPSWQAPMPLARSLEARYIIAEAQLKQGSSAQALALIGERRAVGGQGAFTGTGDDAILSELMEQKSRDFWLEGQRMGDFRRNPNHVPYVLQTGAAYYKPDVGGGVVQNDVCFPLPAVEYERNPNIN
jgi:starch-binding outer membrane protein, SusD/RagB family